MERTLIFLALISASMAAVSVREQDPKPAECADKPGCFIREIQDVIAYGSRIKDPNACQQIICSEEYVQIASCGTVSAQPPCRIVPGDPNGPVYPDCCDQAVCEQPVQQEPSPCDGNQK